VRLFPPLRRVVILSGHERPTFSFTLRLRVTMTKRKKDVDYSSEDSESDFELPVAKKSVVSRHKRHSKTAQKGSTNERAEASALDTYATSHSQSRHLIASPDLMRPSLLKWYSGTHEVRGMPWRKPFDPSLDADARAQRAYEVSCQTSTKSWPLNPVLKVWISEIMLQQTQVATVIPYYNRWMSK
jgi:A/G-specific adenine glycosylase